MPMQPVLHNGMQQSTTFTYYDHSIPTPRTNKWGTHVVWSTCECHASKQGFAYTPLSTEYEQSTVQCLHTTHSSGRTVMATFMHSDATPTIHAVQQAQHNLSNCQLAGCQLVAVDSRCTTKLCDPTKAAVANPQVSQTCQLPAGWTSTVNKKKRLCSATSLTRCR